MPHRRIRGLQHNAQADAGMGEIKRQLLYKSNRRFTKVTMAPAWYPSSKTCSTCGNEPESARIAGPTTTGISMPH